MIHLPSYRAIVDKDEVERLRANAREFRVEANVEVEETRVVVIGYREEHDDYLVVLSDGRSELFARERLWFETGLDGTYPWHHIVVEG